MYFKFKLIYLNVRKDSEATDLLGEDGDNSSEFDLIETPDFPRGIIRRHSQVRKFFSSFFFGFRGECHEKIK